MRILTGAASLDHQLFQFIPQSIEAFGSTVLVEGCEPGRSITWVHAWTVTDGSDGIITQVREYFNTSLTVTRLDNNNNNNNNNSPSSDFSSIATSSNCPSLWESSVPNKFVPGLVLAL
ncbi:Wound-induced protein 1 [Capsicum annuum]|nr:Wound-induced protein 1 [Capsicum annuum]